MAAAEETVPTRLSPAIRMAAPMDLNSIVGSTMVTVDVGIPLAGVIATFTEGAATCWSGSGANRLGETVGTGLIARAMAPSGRVREVLFVDEDEAGSVLLPHRVFADEPSDEVSMGAEPLTLERASALDWDVTLLDELAAFLKQACLGAAARGETLSVQLGSATDVPELQAAFCAFRDGNEWRAHVMTAPIPGHSELWEGAFVDPEEGLASLNAPATPETLAVAGLLMVSAIAGWGVSPYDLVMEYGPAPDGPLPEEQ